MNPVYIVEAARSPIGRRGKSLSTVHPVDLLGAVQAGLIERAGIPAAEVGQIVGGCVGQVGDQSFNIARQAWLSAGLPLEVAATTVDAQCGSAQQAISLAAGLIGSGQEEVAVGCGVESMSRVGMGANFAGGNPMPASYLENYAIGTQFTGAQRLAEKWGVTREDCDRFGVRSQDLAIAAWNEGRYEREVVPIVAPLVDEAGQPTGDTQTVTRDEGLRETNLEKVASLEPVPGNELHTAATASQVSDGAAAVLLASEAGAKRLGLTPRARIVTTTLVGVDPVVMVEGPIPATEKVMAQTGLSLSDMDVVEINEAFASVVLAWERALKPDMSKVNPNGGAIAIGHPVGCTGARLITSALHELERCGGRYGLITMCCGGGLGTATIIERL
ncbi:MAG: steroid 3-ketoacyl-CoA thiolase [Deltaproteobacteria bacterium]|nr:steroid 3-ketoacyl-CoA thiolase [Deltaproteobacteria bacterium]MBW2417897.1 steroid 3-ketoacyl-CoA thiolase [Deltaproteobacteria bacterium]